MEQQIEVLIPEQKMIKSNSKQKLLVIAIISSALFVICFALSGVLFYKYITISKVVADLTSKNSEALVKINDISSKLPDIDLTKVDSRIDSLDRRIYFMNMQHRIEGGLATDDFIVSKATISVLPAIKDGQKGILISTIDLDTQPGSYSKHKGQGKFNVPDRELKSMVQDVINKVANDYYAGSDQYFKGIPQWKDGTVSVTIKNYEIGTFKNGEFKLKGE